MRNEEITIRECVSLEDLNRCVRLQKEVFALPDIEISPLRHLVVTRYAGGFTLGAFAGEMLIGFVLTVPAFHLFQADKPFFYSHMAAVKKDFQSAGIGAKLKWAQRETALARGINYIKWTFQPVQTRNAFFNLEKLGAIIKHYEPNFYGTDYSTQNDPAKNIGLDSDRLFAEWNLESEKVEKLANGEKYMELGAVAGRVAIDFNWDELAANDPRRAVLEQTRLKNEFQKYFADGLICRAFERGTDVSAYLLY